MRSTTRYRALAAVAAGALLLAACGSDDDADATTEAATDDAVVEDDDHDGEEAHDDEGHDDGAHDDHDHDEDHHSHAARSDAEEVPGPEPRLVVADASDAVVHVIDLATGEVLASFDVDAPGAALYVGSGNRAVAAVQTPADTVAFIDAGTFAVDHGDHNHYYVAPPALLDDTLDTGTPIHVTSAFGAFAIFGDVEGAAFLIDEATLTDDGMVDGEVQETGAPHHGGATWITPELLAISGPEDGQEGGLADQVWVFHDGEQVGSYDCPGLHGERPGADWTGFACADRILLLEGHGDHAHAKVVEYPAELGDDFRVGYLASAWDSSVFAAVRGDVLLLVDADAGEATVVELPAEAATRSVVDDDGNLLVLTADGVLHLFDPGSGDLLASSEPVITIDDGEDAPRFSFAGGRDRVYVPVPGEGVIHELATNDGLRLARTIEVGGAPANLAFLGAWPR